MPKKTSSLLSRSASFRPSFTDVLRQKRAFSQAIKKSSKNERKNQVVALHANHSYGAKFIALSCLALMVTTVSLPLVKSFTEYNSVIAAQYTYGYVGDEGMDSQDSIIVSDNVENLAFARDDYTYTMKPKISFLGMKTADTFTNNVDAIIQWPFGEGAPIADGFGPRTPICEGGICSKGFHSGVDFTPGEGTPIQVIADGVVKTVSNNGTSSFGTYVEIEHYIDGEVITSLYAHMKQGSSPLVVGQVVSVGDLVGNVGSTGLSTGPHLHFEIHVNGTPIDPMTWDKWGRV